MVTLEMNLRKQSRQMMIPACFVFVFIITLDVNCGTFFFFYIPASVTDRFNCRCQTFPLIQVHITAKASITSLYCYILFLCLQWLMLKSLYIFYIAVNFINRRVCSGLYYVARWSYDRRLMISLSGLRIGMTQSVWENVFPRNKMSYPALRK